MFTTISGASPMVLFVGGPYLPACCASGSCLPPYFAFLSIPLLYFASLLPVMSHANVVGSFGCLPELYYIAELVVSKIIYHLP